MTETARQAVPLVFVLAVLPTNLYLWTWRFADLRRHEYPYYLHRDEIAALEWLRENTSQDDVVLSSLTVGQYIPAVSGNTAVLAHWAQTVDFYGKRDRVALFFDSGSPDRERKKMLFAFGVDYLFHGPAERALGRYDPSASSLFVEAFWSPRVTLYAVQR